MTDEQVVCGECGRTPSAAGMVLRLRVPGAQEIKWRCWACMTPEEREANREVLARFSVDEMQIVQPTLH